MLEHTISLKAGQSHEYTEGRAGRGLHRRPRPARAVRPRPPQPQSVTLGTTPATITMVNDFAAADLALSVNSAVVDSAGDPVSGVDITLGALQLGVDVLARGTRIRAALGRPGERARCGHLGRGLDRLDRRPAGGCRLHRRREAERRRDRQCSTRWMPARPGPEGAVTIAATGSSVAVDEPVRHDDRRRHQGRDRRRRRPAPTYTAEYACTFDGRPVSFTTPTPIVFEVGETVDVLDVPDRRRLHRDRDRLRARARGHVRAVEDRARRAADTAVTVTNTFTDGNLVVSVGRAGDGSALGARLHRDGRLRVVRRRVQRRTRRWRQDLHRDLRRVLHRHRDRRRRRDRGDLHLDERSCAVGRPSRRSSSRPMARSPSTSSTRSSPPDCSSM